MTGKNRELAAKALSCGQITLADLVIKNPMDHWSINSCWKNQVLCCAGALLSLLWIQTFSTLLAAPGPSAILWQGSEPERFTPRGRDTESDQAWFLSLNSIYSCHCWAWGDSLAWPIKMFCVFSVSYARIYSYWCTYCSSMMLREV